MELILTTMHDEPINDNDDIIIERSMTLCHKLMYFLIEKMHGINKPMMIMISRRYMTLMYVFSGSLRWQKLPTTYQGKAKLDQIDNSVRIGLNSIRADSFSMDNLMALAWNNAQNLFFFIKKQNHVINM